MNFRSSAFWFCFGLVLGCSEDSPPRLRDWAQRPGETREGDRHQAASSAQGVGWQGLLGGTGLLQLLQMTDTSLK